MDASLVSAMYLMPDWMMRILEDYEDEAIECSTSWPLKLIEQEGRKAIWSMCSTLSVETHGVPGQACRLLERYLRNHIMRDFLRPGVIVDFEEWEEYKRSLASRVPLLMASCVQLAAKMSSVGARVNAKLVRTCLLCKSVVFSERDIIRSEFQVFSTLGFRVPLWTSLEIAQMLSVEVGLEPAAVKGVALIINIAEYRRVAIANSVRNIATSSDSTSFSAGSLSTLHLAAGAVAASAKYLASPAPDPVPRLAALTRAPPTYIECVRNVIVADVLIDDSNVNERNTTTRKRKRSPLVV